MKNLENLKSNFKNLDKEINYLLYEQITKCLGKKIFKNSEELEECTNYLTFVDDFTGENIDFRFTGIDNDGYIRGVREDNTEFDPRTLKLSNILIHCKLEILDILINHE